MLDTILDEIKSEVGYFNKKTNQDTRKVTSLRQQIKSDISFNRDPDDDDAPEKVETKVVMGPNGMRRVVEVDSATGEEVDPLNGLGTVRYLYQLAEPNENDRALGVDPSKGSGLYSKIDRYKQLSKTLQDPTKNPERLTLSTVHSVKGAQWKHTALCMSYGFFPANRQDKSVDLESELAKMGATLPWSGPEREEAKAKSHAHIEDPMTAERNLAYVGVTRAETDLQIICSQERVPKKLRENGPVVSQFVGEARLQIGQNVNPVSPQKDLDEESVEVKTASASWVFAHGDADLDHYLEASDISTSYTYGRTL
jgi:superfamily I DNA/RNA helicase